MALSGPKKDPSVSEFNSQPFIPPESLGEVLGQIESALKQLKIDANGVMASITTSDQKTWKIYVKSNRADKIGTKLEHLDIYVIDESKPIGEAQATVLLGQNIITNQIIAVKVQKPNGPSFDEELKLERESLVAANRFFGYCAWIEEVPEQEEKESKDALTTQAEKSVTHYTFMRYFPGVNLIENLYEIKKAEKDKPKTYVSKKKLDDITIARLAVKALQELVFMYDEVKRMHRDIKTGNFVISSSALKLIDLGTALPLDDQTDMHPHSFGYLPPEHCPGEFRRPWNFASDLWQIGIVIAEIMTNENYQAKLHMLDKDIKHVSMDNIKQMMADVLTPEALAKVDEKQNPLRYHLLQLVHRITLERSIDRPLRQEIFEIIPNLTRLISTEQLKATTSTSRLRRGSTAKGSAAVATDAIAIPSPSSPILPSPSKSAAAGKKVPLLRSKSAKKLTNFLDDLFGARSRASSAASAKKEALSPREPLQKSEPLIVEDEIQHLSVSFSDLKLVIPQVSSPVPSPMQEGSPVLEEKMSEAQIMTKLQALKLSFEEMSKTPQSNSGDQLQSLLLSRRLGGVTRLNPDDNNVVRLREIIDRYRPSGRDTVMDKKMKKLGDLLQRLGSPKM